MLSQRQINRIEDLVYDQQYEWIRREFGADVAAVANYGWGAEIANDYVNVSTKVYGKGVLVTMATSTIDIKHMFVDGALIEQRMQGCSD